MRRPSQISPSPLFDQIFRGEGPRLEVLLAVEKFPSQVYPQLNVTIPFLSCVQFLLSNRQTFTTFVPDLRNINFFDSTSGSQRGGVERPGGVRPGQHDAGRGGGGPAAADADEGAAVVPGRQAQAAEQDQEQEVQEAAAQDQGEGEQSFVVAG